MPSDAVSLIALFNVLMLSLVVLDQNAMFFAALMHGNTKTMNIFYNSSWSVSINSLAPDPRSRVSAQWLIFDPQNSMCRWSNIRGPNRNSAIFVSKEYADAGTIVIRNPVDRRYLAPNSQNTALTVRAVTKSPYEWTIETGSIVDEGGTITMTCAIRGANNGLWLGGSGDVTLSTVRTFVTVSFMNPSDDWFKEHCVGSAIASTRCINWCDSNSSACVTPIRDYCTAVPGTPDATIGINTDFCVNKCETEPYLDCDAALTQRCATLIVGQDVQEFIEGPNGEECSCFLSSSFYDGYATSLSNQLSVPISLGQARCFFPTCVNGLPTYDTKNRFTNCPPNIIERVEVLNDGTVVLAKLGTDNVNQDSLQSTTDTKVRTKRGPRHVGIWALGIGGLVIAVIFVGAIINSKRSKKINESSRGYQRRGYMDRQEFRYS